jgi:glycosyltransferase involved in cell wall biosynthesis
MSQVRMTNGVEKKTMRLHEEAAVPSGRRIRVFMITCEWPSAELPHNVPFVVRQVEFLRRAGVEIDLFAFRGAKNPFNYARAWIVLQRKLRTNHYDLIHAQWGQSGFLATPRRLPLVVTFRGGEAEGIVGDNGKYTIGGYVLRAVSYWVAMRADELILVSSHMKEHLPSRPVHIIPSGLDFEKLPIIPQQEARQRLGLPLSKRLVLFASNPAEVRKRYALAQEVVARLDPELNAQLVTAWGVPHSEMPIYMNACDALIFTSMYEGSPNVVKEALACNLPVVSVATGDVQERLSGVQGCVVCPESDPDTLAQELGRILRMRQRVNGRVAVSDLEEGRLTQRVVAIYRECLSRNLNRRRHPALDH